MSVTVSAPGKIYLLGEHSVVYGKPALLAVIDRRIYVKCQSASRRTNVKGQKGIKIISSQNTYLIERAISVFQKYYAIRDIPPIEISVISEVPPGSGLGSSAALSAAIIGALMKYIKNEWDLKCINDLVFEVEKTAHGHPSGADNCAVIYGGLLWFRKESEELKLISSLPQKSYKIPTFILIDSGRPKETTKKMVEAVALLFQKKRKDMEAIMSSQENGTKRLLLALRDGNHKEIVNSIKIGSANLQKMGVVGTNALKIIREVERAGGAAKISGAGGVKKGSGFIMCFHDKSDRIKRIANKFGVSSSPVILGGEGIRIENEEKKIRLIKL
ncbi:mevalonate kinase [Candidatus Gottesmanbacteria bacterium RBG_13_37_7]|uniref:mevalonate kinase n=1 Tax=Candidatus Gottesmanbacteria bacterium RBG_13_37_7 TaxID=1798369 RepID=A0A1F5YGY9_9BACT|nr:MAG: mevalonate kinase [Candidatus Gottesmanbacteria bacterium RBG_13_37_7]